MKSNMRAVMKSKWKKYLSSKDRKEIQVSNNKRVLTWERERCPKKGVWDNQIIKHHSYTWCLFFIQESALRCIYLLKNHRLKYKKFPWATISLFFSIWFYVHVSELYQLNSDDQIKDYVYYMFTKDYFINQRDIIVFSLFFLINSLHKICKFLLPYIVKLYEIICTLFYNNFTYR